jgi:hypothetical protein
MMDDSYYVYTHTDPRARFGFPVRYVGRGRKDRAWQCRSSQRMNPEHVEWLEEILEDFTMADVVKIEAKHLIKEDATRIELELIEQLKPIFNRPLGGPRQITDNEIEQAFILRERGLSYSAVADAIGYTTMTIWRALNGKTKSYG